MVHQYHVMNFPTVDCQSCYSIDMAEVVGFNAICLVTIEMVFTPEEWSDRSDDE